MMALVFSFFFCLCFFNTLSRLVIAFLPRSKHFLVLWLQSLSTVTLRYRCESWIIEEADLQRISAFQLLCWGRLLKLHWTARRSNQSVLKEINPDYSLEGLKLKRQYFGHVMWRADSLKKTLMLGKTEGRKRSRGQRMRWMASLTQWTWVWANSRRSEDWKPGMLQFMELQRVRHDLATEQ